MARFIIISVLFILWLTAPVKAIYADSDQSYSDYLYQFDQYRQKYNNFRVAKNEYDKFKTLTSESTALESAKIMLAQRDILLKTYLVFLSEKLNENKGLDETDKSLYQNLLKNEIAFLDGHRDLIPAVGTIADAVSVSKQLESHYLVLQISVRQIINGIAIGDLSLLTNSFDTTFDNISLFVNTNRADIPLSKQGIADRWLVSIRNKRTLLQNKLESISSANTQLNASSQTELERSHISIQNQLYEARTYLSEATSNTNELLNSLRYLY